MVNTHTLSFPGQRFGELDVLRGLALVGMILYHLLFDLQWLGWLNIELSGWEWKGLQTLTAGTFLVLVGMGLYLKIQRLALQPRSYQIWALVGRAGCVGMWAGVITLVSQWWLPEWPIVFGVLHCIAAATLLCIPLLMVRDSWYWPRLLWGLMIGGIVGGGIVAQYRVTTWWWVWLGLRPVAFATLDYFPLLPWLSCVVLGLIIANWLYPYGQRGPVANTLLKKMAERGQRLQWLGRHSLIVYLVHQPLILAGLWVIKSVIE